MILMNVLICFLLWGYTLYNAITVVVLNRWIMVIHYEDCITLGYLLVFVIHHALSVVLLSIMAAFGW